MQLVNNNNNNNKVYILVLGWKYTGEFNKTFTPAI